MSTKSLFAILVIFVIGNSAWAAGCDAPSVTLKQGQWKQISLPCAPVRRGDSVMDIFGSIGGTYDKDWVVFSYDGSNYQKKLIGTDNDFLEQGEGYWIIQMRSDSITLKMPDTASPTATNYEDFNGNPGFRYSLSTQSGEVRWNFLGNPYAADLKLKISSDTFGVGDNPVVQTKKGSSCAKSGPVEGCGLFGAEKSKVFHNQLFHYDGDAKEYIKVENGGQLSSWDGFWGATLSGADTEEPKIIFMKP